MELLGRSMGRSIILPLKVVKVTKCPAGENQKFKTFRCLKTKFKSNKITRECIYIFFSNFHGFGILFCFFLSFLFWRWLWNPLKPTPLCATALEAVVWSCFVNKLFLKICKDLLENTCVVLALLKIRLRRWCFQMFHCEFCEI